MSKTGRQKMSTISSTSASSSGAFGLDSLPNELLLSIIIHACTSKEPYRTCLLLNRRMNELVTAAELLPKLPIRINKPSVPPFQSRLSDEAFANSITYLWINGPTFKRMGSAVCQDIVMGCPKLQSLACTTSLLYIISEAASSRKQDFPDLKALTLFAHDYTSWRTLTESAACDYITPRITHLRLQYRVPPEFADIEEGWFPELTHYAIMVTATTKALVKEEFENIIPRDKVEQIVITTFETPEEVKQEALEWDERIQYHFMDAKTKAMDEFVLWSGRALGTDTVWTSGTRYL